MKYVLYRLNEEEKLIEYLTDAQTWSRFPAQAWRMSEQITKIMQYTHGGTIIQESDI